MLATIFQYYFLFVALVTLCSCIFYMRYQYAAEIYLIWYIFSLFFLVFLVINLVAEKKHVPIANVFGTSLFEVVYSTLTDIDSEISLVAGTVALVIGPQLLTYVLSGLSGSASPPVFVGRIQTIAAWSLIKFLAGVGGILIAQLLVKLLSEKPISKQELIAAIFPLSFAFLIAHAQLHLGGDGKFWFLMRRRSFRKIHAFFTRYTRQLSGPKTPSAAELRSAVNVANYVQSLFHHHKSRSHSEDIP
jgi:hypothetical protein